MSRVNVIITLVLIAGFLAFFNAHLGIHKSGASSDPGALQAKKISQEQCPSYFPDMFFAEQFSHLNEACWYKNDYTFTSNGGHFEVQNVTVTHDLLTMVSPKNSFNGAGVESKSVYGYGTYTARIQCPKAPGMLCAFFLYQPTQDDASDEIDIEIFANGSRRVELVAYMKGKKIHFFPAVLPFDPSDGFHEYQIRYFPNTVEFFADNQLLKRLTHSLPENQVKIMTNFWWPMWMPQSPEHMDNYYMYVDWIMYVPY